MRVALVYLNDDQMISRGAGYILQASRGAGHSVDFYDTCWHGYNRTVSDVSLGHYDVVMLSCTSLYAGRAVDLARAVKTSGDPAILVGGVHPTVVGGKFLAENPCIDYLCLGEGEEFVVEFLDRMEHDRPMEDLQNLIWRRPDSSVVVNPVRPPTDLHLLPAFDHGNFDPRSVITKQSCLQGFTYVFATRGCPYRCTYCSNDTFLDLYGKKYLRTQRIDTVLQELQQIRDNYPVKIFYFGDEMILFDLEYVTELFHKVHDEIGMPYGVMCRTDCVTPKVVDLLKRTGCKYAAMGIECGDEQFRREYLNRRNSNAQIVEAFHSLRKAIPDIFLVSFNMKGYPVSYDQRLLQATEALNWQAAPNHVQTTWLYPLPGTRLYDYCVERDLIDWTKYHDLSSYFRQSVLKHPIPPRMDNPIYHGN